MITASFPQFTVKMWFISLIFTYFLTIRNPFLEYHNAKNFLHNVSNFSKNPIFSIN